MFQKLSKLTLSNKIIGLVLFSSIAIASITGVVNYQKAAATEHHEIEEKLKVIGELSKAELEQYLEFIDGDLKHFTKDPSIINALESFNSAYYEGALNPTQTWQDAYIKNNPNPTGAKENLDRAQADHPYNSLHGTYHPWIRSFLKDRGFYDIFLFNLKGDMIYSVFKESDFATNFLNGEYAQSDLGKVFRDVISKNNPNYISYYDYAPYAPSNGAAASFIGKGVFNKNGQMIGVAAFQMPVDRLNEVLAVEFGLGETGEAYLFGADGFMRNDIPNHPESTILSQKVDPKTLAHLNSGQGDILEKKDYSGTTVLAYITELNFHGTTWGLVAQIDNEEVMAPIFDLRNTMIITTLSVLAGICLLAYFLTQKMVGRPLNYITKAINNLASGDTASKIDYTDRQDDIGSIARSLDSFKTALIQNAENEEREKSVIKTREERAIFVANASKEFESSINELTSSTSDASENLQKTANTLSSIAEETSAQTNTVAAAAEESSINVQSVADAANQISDLTKEVTELAEKSRQKVSNASQQANHSSEKIAKLEEAATSIGDVVNMITEIAEQTNLLALNATIEAARAGEAGKGFAVVASEVKELANETSKATEQIATQIGLIQNTTKESVESIKNVEKVISEIDETINTVSEATQQQLQAINEISHNSSEVAEGNKEVARNIADVTQAASETGQSSQEVLASATSLGEQTNRMKQCVEKFLTDIKED